MVIERKFISENIRKSQIQEFLEKEFANAGFSHAEIARTPVATRVTVWAQKPGIIIGRGGKTIDALTETLKIKFGLENPQLDVQDVEKPDLDAHIVARQIASAIERGLQYKRVVQLTIQRVMDSGAVGVAIRIGGKLGGEVSRVEKFAAGYLKYAGEPAEKLDKAQARAMVKLGAIGIQVRILTEAPKELVAAEKIRETPAAQEVKLEVRREVPVQEPSVEPAEPVEATAETETATEPKKRKSTKIEGHVESEVTEDAVAKGVADVEQTETKEEGGEEGSEEEGPDMVVEEETKTTEGAEEPGEAG